MITRYALSSRPDDELRSGSDQPETREGSPTPEHVLRRDAARRRGPLGVCPVCDLPESVMFVDPHPDAPDASCLRCGEPFALVPVALLVEETDR